jgi:rubredoxin
LTIRAEELGDSYCPECYEADGNKKYDFEKIETKEPETDRYRCEKCGAIIESKK